MKRLRWGKRLAALGALLVLFAAGFSASAALPGYDRQGRLALVGEPEDAHPQVGYYVDGKLQSWDSLTWVDGGRSGKAMLLDGSGGYLVVGYDQLKLPKMTFSAWVNWQGAADSADPATALGQRLFTIRRSDSAYLTLSPWMQDDTLTKDGGSLNGLYMNFRYNNTVLHMFNPAKEDACFALPQNEWHHVAVTSDGLKLCLYIDGVLWLQEQLVMTVAELRALQFMLGTGAADGTPLHAMLDDAALYDRAMTAEQVKMLAHDIDPLASGATVPTDPPAYIATRPATTTTPPTTTAPSATTTAPTTQRAAGSYTVFGMNLPAWTLWTIGGVVLVYIVLSIILSVYAKRKK